MDKNVGLQRLFGNVNAIPPTIVPPANKACGVGSAKQENLIDMVKNWEDTKLEDHVMEVVQQTQIIVENVQAEADSMQDYDRMMAEAAASEPGDPLGRPGTSDGATSPEDVVHALNLTDVLLSCHPLFAGSSVTKLAATILIITICTMHGVNNKFVDELLYLLHKYILPQPNSLPSNINHAKVLVKKIGYSYESIYVCNNGCVLFQGDTYKDMTKCPGCNANQYKAYGKSQVSVSVLKHFPLIPWLVRWYKSPRIAGLLKWAHLNKSTNGKIHGVHDSLAWCAIDTKFPSFRRSF